MDSFRGLSVSTLLETSTSNPLMALGAVALCLSAVYILVSIVYEAIQPMNFLG